MAKQDYSLVEHVNPAFRPVIFAGLAFAKECLQSNGTGLNADDVEERGKLAESLDDRLLLLVGDRIVQNNGSEAPKASHRGHDAQVLHAKCPETGAP